MFVRWSADLEHPWDAASSQNVPAAVLEVGVCRCCWAGCAVQVLREGRSNPQGTSQAAHLIHLISATHASVGWPKLHMPLPPSSL